MQRKKSASTANGSKGSANDTHISFEICEDDLTNSSYFNAIYKEATELCAYLCKEFKLSENAVIGHDEGFKLGISSNHADPSHWFSRHGKSMNSFRNEVKNLLVTVTNSEKLFKIQIGAFSVKSNAENCLKRAKSANFSDAFIVKVGNLYKVQIGAFSVKSNAEKRLQEAKNKNFSDAFISQD